MTTTKPAASLLPGERLIEAAGFQVLAYCRTASEDLPAIVFLPGAGFLARVAYGHPGAEKRDFIDHWLGKRGHPLLALSYPSDHPIFERVYPRMTSREWGESAAAATEAVLRDSGLGTGRPIVLLAWSMAGRAVGTYAAAATRRGLRLEGCVSLAASAPIPGMIPGPPEGEPLAASGLWEVGAPPPRGRDRVKIWLQELAAIAEANGRDVISEADCRSYYWVNTPIQLRGEAQRLAADGTSVSDLAAALADLGTLEFGAFPITAAILPTHPIDARHALTDAATWAFFNAQKIVQTWLVGTGIDPLMLPEPAWQALRRLMLDLPKRLSREIAGGHFFFLGEMGARATVEHMADLAAAVAAVRGELSAIAAAGLEAQRPRRG
jgi:hypothetical protein